MTEQEALDMAARAAGWSSYEKACHQEGIDMMNMVDTYAASIIETAIACEALRQIACETYDSLANGWAAADRCAAIARDALKRIDL